LLVVSLKTNRGPEQAFVRLGGDRTPIKVHPARSPSKNETPMSVLRKFIDYFKPTPQPEPHARLPEGKLRLHLLCGSFESADAAMTYCFQADGDTPEQITIDQPGAFIDTGFVEVVFRTIAPRLLDFLSADDVSRTIARMNGANTLVIITEDAFGGFPYVLSHSETLYYLGPYIVDV
tara:strand:+ start:467 stop:997 length:531 start_codon:yes stop_codon:yes gene_type:complete